MYSFTPTEEQQMLLDAVKRFAETDVRPASREAEESTEFPSTLIEKGWNLGILQASIPDAYGGFGDYSVLNGVLAAEGLANGDLAVTMGIMTPNLLLIFMNNKIRSAVSRKDI